MRIFLFALGLFLSMIGFAIAQSNTSNQHQPPGTDLHAELRLAFLSHQSCNNLPYYEQLYIDRAARLRFSGSQEDTAIKAAPEAQRPAVRARWREARKAEVARRGCGGLMALRTKALQIAYLEVAQTIITARHLRTEPNVAEFMTALTPEEQELHAMYVESVRQVFGRDFPKFEEAAAQLASERLRSRTSAWFNEDHAFLLSHLSFQVSAMQAGFRPRLMASETEAGGLNTHVTMSRLETPADVMIRSLAGPMQLEITTVRDVKRPMRVFVYERSGVVTVALYGAPMERYRESPLLRVFAHVAGGPIAATKTIPELCPFALCFSLSPDQVNTINTQLNAPDSRFDIVLSLIPGDHFAGDARNLRVPINTVAFREALGASQQRN